MTKLEWLVMDDKLSGFVQIWSEADVATGEREWDTEIIMADYETVEVELSTITIDGGVITVYVGKHIDGDTYVVPTDGLERSDVVKYGFGADVEAAYHDAIN